MAEIFQAVWKSAGFEFWRSQFFVILSCQALLSARESFPFPLYKQGIIFHLGAFVEDSPGTIHFVRMFGVASVMLDSDGIAHLV